MEEFRLLPIQILADLCFVDSIRHAEAVKTDMGWRLIFWLGKDKFNHSRVGLRAARGGERFYKSLDSAHDLLVKIGCKSLTVGIRPRVLGSAEPAVEPVLNRRVGGVRVKPGLERLRELMAKERKGHLTRLERDEKKDLALRFDVNKS